MKCSTLWSADWDHLRNSLEMEKIGKENQVLVHLGMKIKNAMLGMTKRWGPSRVKRKLWDQEYASGNWNHCEHTASDNIYAFIERYCRNGSILDLGCGSGNTGNELRLDKYESYTGMDISEVAVQKATQRSEMEGRATKNRYLQSDILSYVPTRRHDVILFREALYQIPEVKFKPTLDRYRQALSAEGVFIVRVSSDGTRRFKEIVDWIESNYSVVEKYSSAEGDAFILVFR